MRDVIFCGLDVHKATISVAVVQGACGGVVRSCGTVPNRADHVRSLPRSWTATGVGSICATRPVSAAMVCTDN